MARKRKLDSSKSTDPIETPKKQQIAVEEPVKEVPVEDTPEYEVEEDEEEEQEQEQEENEEEEEEEDEEDEEEEEEGDENANNNHHENPNLSSSSIAVIDEDDEPIQNLLEPFSKEQLVSLLREAAEKHSDIEDRIRQVADADPAHRKIFVHGLGWDTTAETLISVFKQYGDIEDCKAVCDKVSGKSKGYGFILFKKRSGARKALKEPQKKIGSRMTACQLASVGPVPGTAAAIATPQAPPASEYTQRKIYVSNVGADVEPHKLLSFFSQFGEVEEGPLGLDKVTGKPKGFCLFVYKGVDGARKALEEPHKNFEGHMLHCQKAIDGPKPGKAQHQHSSHNSQYQRNKNPNYASSTASGSGHLMAPAGPGVGYNQGPPQALNPALGQALTALFASQGAGLGLTNLLGTLGSAGMNPAVQGAGPGIQSGYGSQTTISPGVVGYGTQSAVQGGYPNQQMGQSGTGRGQHGVGQYGAPGSYMGH